MNKLEGFRWSSIGFKKNGQLCREVRMEWLEKNSLLSKSRQCELVGLPRSSAYYTPLGETELNLELMRLLDEEYTKHPFFGSRRLQIFLQRQGYEVNRKRVQRLMHVMGLAAIYPKRSLSQSCEAHKKYPYLLSGLIIDRPNQVWSTDITYIRMRHGFLYLVAVMDWYSRFVLSWELSNTLDTGFCLTALEKAIGQGCPEIFNMDQGVQFTSEKFTGRLLTEGIQISMDGRGRVFDNIFIERLWRSVKYEDIYLHDYETNRDLFSGLKRYFDFYDYERPHQSLEYRTPAEVHFSKGYKNGHLSN